MFTVGADPEFFLLDEKNRPISAHEFIGGRKDDPFPLLDGAVQVDGTAVEFNIKPAFNAKEFVYNIESVLMQVRGMIPQELKFHFVPSIIYPEVYFKKLPFICRELGCEPDFDAYNLGHMNPPPEGNKTTMRTGAGHIHIGFETDDNHRRHVMDCCNLVIGLDATLGMLEKAWCDDNTRRSLYGKRGAFRPKPYGVEYRVLSNSWLKYPKLWPWLFDMCEFVADRVILRREEMSKVIQEPVFGVDRIHLPENWPQFPRDWKEDAEKAPWL